MSGPAAPIATPPWRYSKQLGGEYTWNPSTDEVVLKDGRRFSRPPRVPRSALQDASYDGPLPSPSLYSRSSSLGPNHLVQSLASVKLGPSDLPNTRDRRAEPPVTLDGDRETRVVFQKVTASQIQRGEPARPPGIGERDVAVTSTIAARLFPEYQLRSRKFFRIGVVFLVLWSEPAGGSSVVTRWEPGIVLNQLGERVFSKVRRFVVIREGSNSCSALPISTYAGQGVAKRGVTKSDHCIIYTSRDPPKPHPRELPRRNEEGMRPVPIRMDAASPAEILDPMCRLNLAGVTLIQHNLKAKSSGRVNENSLRDLMQQFEAAWGNFPVPTLAPGAAGKNSDEEEGDKEDDNEDADEECDSDDGDNLEDDGEEDDDEEDEEQHDEQDEDEDEKILVEWKEGKGEGG